MIEVEIAEFLTVDYRRVVATVALITGNRAFAEDVVQEALARAWERSMRGRAIDSLAGWVTAVAVNLARSGIRRRRIEGRVNEKVGVSGGALAGDDVEDRLDLAAAVRLLPRRQREVVVLRHYLGLGVRDIALTLKVSEGTVKTSLHRAHRTLAPVIGVSISFRGAQHDR